MKQNLYVHIIFIIHFLNSNMLLVHIIFLTTNINLIIYIYIYYFILKLFTFTSVLSIHSPNSYFLLKHIITQLHKFNHTYMIYCFPKKNNFIVYCCFFYYFLDFFFPTSPLVLITFHPIEFFFIFFLEFPFDISVKSNY